MYLAEVRPIIAMMTKRRGTIDKMGSREVHVMATCDHAYGLFDMIRFISRLGIRIIPGVMIVVRGVVENEPASWSVK